MASMTSSAASQDTIQRFHRMTTAEEQAIWHRQLPLPAED
jgi:hypothetical protein